MPRSHRFLQRASAIFALVVCLMILTACRAQPADHADEEPEEAQSEQEETAAEDEEETTDEDESASEEQGEDETPTTFGELPPPPAPALQAPRELRLDRPSSGLTLTPQPSTPTTQGLSGGQLRLQRSPSGLQLREDNDGE